MVFLSAEIRDRVETVYRQFMPVRIIPETLNALEHIAHPIGDDSSNFELFGLRD